MGPGEWKRGLGWRHGLLLQHSRDGASRVSMHRSGVHDPVRAGDATATDSLDERAPSRRVSERETNVRFWQILLI